MLDRSSLVRVALFCAVLLSMPLLLGQSGGGCATTSMDPAPDMTGTWNITYDDTFMVEINIGGAIYTQELGVVGGVINLTHEGTPLTFMLDCSLPQIVCPSESLPATVTASHRDEDFPHRVYITITKTECMGTLVDPDPMECGADTLNPGCEQVCDGEVGPVDTDLYGEINVAGDRYNVLLGGGAATNGLNCALLSLSVANADLVTSGSAEDGSWRVESLENGVITTGYAGGCIWIDDVDMDADLEASVVGATVTVRTGFTAAR